MNIGMFKVRIKTWKEMEKEFGVSNFGSIVCKFSFTKEMEISLKNNRIIFLDENFVFRSKSFHYDKFLYSHDMIKEYFIMENIWNNIKGN